MRRRTAQEVLQEGGVWSEVEMSDRKPQSPPPPAALGEAADAQTLGGAGVRVNAARVGLVMQESSKEKWSVDYRSRSTSKEEKGAEAEGKGRGAWHLYGGILC